jgi:hypothetical protein
MMKSCFSSKALVRRGLLNINPDHQYSDGAEEVHEPV